MTYLTHGWSEIIFSTSKLHVVYSATGFPIENDLTRQIEMISVPGVSSFQQNTSHVDMIPLYNLFLFVTSYKNILVYY